MTLTYTPGINDHDLMWSSPAQQAQAIADMVALGVKVHRCDLYITDLTDPTKVVQTTQTFIGWVGLLKAAGIQPFPVITWNDPNAAQTLPDGRVAGAALATLAKQVPGVWWEYGNEWESQEGGPSTSRALAYVISFAQVVADIQAADPGCKIGPSPVANINRGGWGWSWTQYTFQAGLGAVPYDFLPFHWYQYPGNLPPTADFNNDPGPGPFLTCIPTFTAQVTTWGNKAPYWLTECGWQSLTTGSGDGQPEMTQALQATYITEFLQAITGYGLAVVILYELGDGGNQLFGLMTANWAAQKPSYAAVQALLKPAPAPNYQSLYQAALAQIQSVGVNQPTQWLAANPGQPARSYLASLAGKNAAWLKGHPAS